MIILIIISSVYRLGLVLCYLQGYSVWRLSVIYLTPTCSCQFSKEIHMYYIRYVGRYELHIYVCICVCVSFLFVAGQIINNIVRRQSRRQTRKKGYQQCPEVWIPLQFVTKKWWLFLFLCTYAILTYIVCMCTYVICTYVPMSYMPMSHVPIP